MYVKDSKGSLREKTVRETMRGCVESKGNYQREVKEGLKGWRKRGIHWIGRGGMKEETGRSKVSVGA